MSPYAKEILVKPLRRADTNIHKISVGNEMVKILPQKVEDCPWPLPGIHQNKITTFHENAG